MASSPASITNFKRIKNYPLERRPRMLKDFLTDDSNSCSSSGFKSFPRLHTRNLLHLQPDGLPTLKRSRSKAAASAISALHTVFAAVKKLHSLAAVNSPAILPRSLSQRRSKRAHSVHSNEVKNITVTIKDIIRWRSFRDLAEDESQSPPLDFALSPQRCTMGTVTTGSTSTAASTPCSSSGSSWCDSDFTAEDSPSRGGNSEECGKKFYSHRHVCRDPPEAKTGVAAAAKEEVGPKVSPTNDSIWGTSKNEHEELEFEEQEQHSPMSVLDVEYEEDEKLQATAKMERTGSRQRPMQKTRRLENLTKWDPVNLEEETTSSFEEEEEDYDVDDEKEHEQEEGNEVEEKARQLLEHVKATTSFGSRCCYMDKLLLGFFTEALMAPKQIGIGEINEIIEQAEAWINGGQIGVKWEEGNCTRKACERDLEDKGRWTKFKKEEEELALAIESGVTGLLVDELVTDLKRFKKKNNCFIQIRQQYNLEPVKLG